MCGAKVGCVVYEGYAFFIKDAHLLNCSPLTALLSQYIIFLSPLHSY